MSLQGSLLSAKPKNKELVPSLTIQIEHISHLQTGIEEVGIPSSHALLAPLESSGKWQKKDFTPHFPTTNSVKDGAGGRSHPSDNLLTGCSAPWPSILAIYLWDMLSI